MQQKAIQHLVLRCHCCLVPKRSFIVNCELHNLNFSTTNWKQKDMFLFQDLIFLAKCQKFGHKATSVSNFCHRVMTIFVALSGCTRSGKSILAKMLEEHLDDVKVVHQDTWPCHLLKCYEMIANKKHVSNEKVCFSHQSCGCKWVEEKCSCRNGLIMSKSALML